MRSHDVRDLPYKVGSNLSYDEMDNLLSYCKHDVKETYNFLQHSLKHIELRKFYTNYEGINLINASEIKMSKEIFAKQLSKPMQMEAKDIKKLRTFRNEIPIKDLIFPYIKFNDAKNNIILDKFQNFIWRAGNNLSFQSNYKNIKREYAEGGLHSFGEKSKIYKSNDEYLLVDVDFASYYPHISFKNNLHPQHIPANIFNEIYEGFYKERKKYPKSDPRNYVLKIILNGSYGLSKDMYSFLYDPKWQLAITINGQLILTMLTEYICNALSEVEIVFENTDGAMYYIKRNELSKLEQACKEIEQIVNIPLEIQKCESIIGKDVNNYINVIEKDYIKFKGAFEIDRDFHKNHSKRIVPIALANYFINDVKPEHTIKNHLNNKDYSFAKNYGIFDFCHGAKMKGDNKLFARSIKGVNIIDEPLAKMNRYYVSNTGVELIKKLPPLEKNKITDTDKAPDNQMNIFDIVEDVKIEPKDRETNIEAEHICTIFNKYVEKNDYNINYNYYINECYKIINLFK